ncbi:hypothetical protein [Photobacterium indicum]|uniref:hypothetical protein n=1 Tax=Photobacterium indicum TaxID=81447 RepID=UPI003D0D43F9
MIISSISEIDNGVVNYNQFTVTCYAENQTAEDVATFRISRRVANQLNALADIVYEVGDGKLAHQFHIEAQSLELYGNSLMSF